MRRREFFALVAGTAAAPLTVRAQRTLQRLGVLANADDSPVSGQELAALVEELGRLGWSEGRNLAFDYRLGGGNPQLYRTSAAELVRLSPDVILVQGTARLTAVLRETRTIPVVFVTVADPVGQGFVSNLGHPGGNVTGFSYFDFSVGGKWLDLLREIVPNLSRAAVLYNPATQPTGPFYVGALRAVAQSRDVEVHDLRVRDGAEIAATITSFARVARGGLIVLLDTFAALNERTIIDSAAQARLHAVYGHRRFTATGGLMSFGIDGPGMLRSAATYIDRILKGAKPAELPVQGPTKFELVVNLKTAKALGIAIPQSILLRADEVIE